MSSDGDLVVVNTEELVDVPENLSTQTPLHSKWTFYYLSRKNAGSNIRKDYQEAIEPVGTFQTAEHFWRIYDHLLKPNDIKGGAVDYHLFKNDIKPAWEDPANQDGGKWLLKLRKGLASRCWEDLVLAVIGEQFDVGHEICGIVVSMRGHEDRISIWNKTADNAEAIAKIEYSLKKILNLPNFVQLDYQRHHDRVEATNNGGSGKPFNNTTVEGQNKSHGNTSWGNKTENRSHRYKDNENEGGEKHHRSNNRDNRDRDNSNRDGHGQDGHRRTWNKKDDNQSNQNWGRSGGENSSPRPPPTGSSSNSWGKSTNKPTNNDSSWTSSSNNNSSGSNSNSWGKKKSDSGSNSNGNWSRGSN